VLMDAKRGVSVARGVAAARALPGLRPAVAVDGYTLVDAALGTATNADLLCAGVEHIVIVTAAPAVAPPGTLDGEFAAGLAAERRVLERAGSRITAVHAGASDRAAMGDDLFSVADVAGAVASGRERGRLAAARLLPRNVAA
jgi:predicted acylesterase/phospholipase RssA